MIADVCIENFEILYARERVSRRLFIPFSTKHRLSLSETNTRIRSYPPSDPLMLRKIVRRKEGEGREKKNGREKEKEIINFDRRMVEAIGKTRRDPVVRWSGCRNVRLRYSRSGCPDGEVSWSD